MEGGFVGVHRAEDNLVLQHEITHELVALQLDVALRRRDAGEDKHPVQPQVHHHVEGRFRHAHGLIDEVNVPHALGELGRRGVGDGEVFRAEGLDERGLVVGLGRAGINVGVEAVEHAGHRAEDADGAGPEHDGAQALALGLAGFFARPREALLDFPNLREALFGTGQRLGQHGEVAQLLRHDDEVLFVVHEELGHVAVVLVDPAFVELPRRAKVLAVHTARTAVRVRARAAHRRHDEVADLELLHARADFDDFAERLVTEHEVVRAGGRRAIDEGANLAVRPADAHVERADLELGGAGNLRVSVFDLGDLPLGRDDGHGAHLGLVHVRLIQAHQRATRRDGH